MLKPGDYVVPSEDSIYHNLIGVVVKIVDEDDEEFGMTDEELALINFSLPNNPTALFQVFDRFKEFYCINTLADLESYMCEAVVPTSVLEIYHEVT